MSISENAENHTNTADDLQLISPSPEYLERYCDFCEETFNFVHNSYLVHNPAQASEWKKTIFSDFEASAKGIGLPEGYVPSITFWIVHNENIVACANIRLKLNKNLEDWGGHLGIVVRPSQRNRGYSKKALVLLIDKCHEIGISPILVTTKDSNIAGTKTLRSLPCIKEESTETMADGEFCLIHKFWYK
ncbi:MAG: GNAT family N-acetyltransferase, partial [Bacteroidales bacterium]|nr:GNAT family N-acetyltransferase [Bacteroidales bacterium]